MRFNKGLDPGGKNLVEGLALLERRAQYFGGFFGISRVRPPNDNDRSLPIGRESVFKSLVALVPVLIAFGLDELSQVRV